MHIPENLYLQIISCVPITCVDILIQNQRQEYLLVKRNDEPLRGEFWVVGGRLSIDESQVAACQRKCRDEVGLEIPEGDFCFVGVYDDSFESNAFQAPTLYRTISMVYRATVPDNVLVVLDKDHSEFSWSVDLPPRLKLIKTS